VDLAYAGSDTNHCLDCSHLKDTNARGRGGRGHDGSDSYHELPTIPGSNYQLTEMWSGPVGQAGVVSFGTTSAQFCVFLVIEPRDTPRLHVLNAYTNNYLWIDSSAVGTNHGPGAPSSRTGSQ
jgi:hypothetical protein